MKLMNVAWVVRKSLHTPFLVHTLFPPVGFTMQLLDRWAPSLHTSLLIWAESIFSPLMIVGNDYASAVWYC